MTGISETAFSRAVQTFRDWRAASRLAARWPDYREAFRAECESRCGDPVRAEECARFLDCFVSQGFEDLTALAELMLERMP